jgi:hypothetical protein
VNPLKNMIPTIIVVQELHAEFRGYYLKGREFRLAKPLPIKDEATTLDGKKIVDDYYVVSKEEYMRVVPEAQNKDFDGDYMYIPTFMVKPSFRPMYIKSSPKKLLS